MLQRIQTVYWLVSIVLLVVLIFLPVFEYDQGSFMTTYCKALAISIIVVAILTGITISLYKNRKFQIRFGYGLICLHLLIYFFIGAHFYIDIGTQLLPWIGLPLLSLLFQILAVRSIKKDEALIKSMDRLR